MLVTVNFISEVFEAVNHPMHTNSGVPKIFERGFVRSQPNVVNKKIYLRGSKKRSSI